MEVQQRSTLKYNIHSSSLSDLESDINDYDGKLRSRQTMKPVCSETGSNSGSLFDYYEQRVKRMKQMKEGEE